MPSAHIVGFSLGGMIAQVLALQHADRVRRLVLLSAVAGRTAEERERVQQRLAILRNKASRRSPVRRRNAGSRQNSSRQSGPGGGANAQLQENHAPSYAAAYTVFSISDLGDRLHAIRAPTLVATGEHDVGSNTRMARFMHEQIAGSKLEILPGLRHSILVEAPELVTRLVRDFLQE